MDPDVFRDRTRRCQRRLADRDAGLVLSAGPNQYYLSGFHEEGGERHLLCFVPPEGDPAFVVPELYGDQVRAESWIETVRTYADDEDPRPLIESVAADRGLTDAELLLDPRMWARFTLDLQDAFPDATFGLAAEVLDPLRMTKDGAELDALRRAADVADEVMDDLRADAGALVGRTEQAVAAEIERRLREAGGTGAAFAGVVGSGPNGARPHHRHGERVIQRGDPVVFDFGARVDHYPSDQTRTIVPGGHPPEGFEAAHDAVLAAQTAAVEAVEPGVSAAAVDRAARSTIEDRGFGDAFIHRTGHGVGLEVHEAPYIVGDSDETLEPGMVFSVEPGLYLEGEFGVRIEDLVVVTEDGCERLNDTARDWRP